VGNCANTKSKAVQQMRSHGLIIGRISGPQRQTEDHKKFKRKKKKKKTIMCAKKESI
jgi:hypothetical protein